MIMFMKGFEWDLLHEFQWRKARVTAGRNFAASAVIETLKQRGPEMQSLAVHRERSIIMPRSAIISFRLRKLTL